MDIGNTSVQLFGTINAGGIKDLGKWGDLATLQGERASAFSGSGSLLDLGALGRQAEIGQNLGSVEAAALPVVLRGLTVDVTSMNKMGCASLAAISAVALADMSQSAPQVFILASSELALKPIRARIAAVSKETVQTSFSSLSGHVCVGTATEAIQSGGIKGAKFVVIPDGDELSSGQGDTADRLALLIDTAASKRPQVLLIGTERAEKRSAKVKGLQANILGSDGHIQITDGKDLFDFMAKSKFAVSAVVFSSLGVHDLQSLMTTDPRHLHDKLGGALASKMTMELEAYQHQQMQSSSGHVPPFDICSGQWEWTPDSKEKWMAKGLDERYFHTEPDNSTWVLSYASQALLNAAHSAAYARAPWDVDPDLDCEGMPDELDHDYYEDDLSPHTPAHDYDEADAAWAEMMGSQGAVADPSWAEDAPAAAPLDDYDEADAAWAEMMGSQGAGAQRGGGSAFDMGGVQAALPVQQPTARLSAELTSFLSGLQVDPAQCRILAGALERFGFQRVNELREIRWSLTQTLGIDYGLACAIGQGLDGWPGT